LNSKVCATARRREWFAKSGKFYAVDERYEQAIAERFRHWPQAAITYFGILVSPCKQRIQLPDAKVMVVKDRTLGTNDCRGWISQSVFARLHLPAHRCINSAWRLRTHKPRRMQSDVGRCRSEARSDIIVPESCVKPEYKQSSRFLEFLHWRRPKIEVRSYRGRCIWHPGRLQGSSFRAVTRSSSTHPGNQCSSRSCRLPWSRPENFAVPVKTNV